MGLFDISDRRPIFKPQVLDYFVCRHTLNASLLFSAAHEDRYMIWIRDVCHDANMYFRLESLIERISLVKFIYQQRLLSLLLLTVPCKDVKYKRFCLFHFLFEQSLIEQDVNFFCFLHTSVFDNKKVFIRNIILSLHEISEFLAILLGLRYIAVSLLIQWLQSFDLIV